MGVRTNIHKGRLGHPEERQLGCEIELLAHFPNPREHCSIAKTEDHLKAIEYVCKEAHRKKHADEGEYLSREEYQNRASQFALEHYTEKLQRVTTQRLHYDAKNAWPEVMWGAVILIVQDLDEAYGKPLVDSILEYLPLREPLTLPAQNDFRSPQSTFMA